ncbi:MULTISPECIES: hypothetical protein [Carnobacterium]|uniref:Uncharacterized protein n=1 Tax=Carnobacterium divergens TaxID=2748 RepID=A0A2R8A387_CARDV|nr:MULTISPECIES: hypothetical protein [Carnobacterium]MCO6016843.1 hypothetical protein [Carnobacterium divergens]MDT1940566.1 hypothetical protein [Carnobacterium divergens]MDT1943004.1 hypothetical protein [Carnobacterium divergens]MDT1948811.1 hypothetical protein [Carnobacterium divergens]MDT1951291.1 hypothetical protein [Carnobacterium divergens]
MVDIEFYKEQDEEAFLERWEAKFGEIEDIDVFYQTIATTVQKEYEQNQVKLGNKYVYEGILVGYVDYNTYNNWFLFSSSKL